jgi:hypothetical protein
MQRTGNMRQVILPLFGGQLGLCHSVPYLATLRFTPSFNCCGQVQLQKKESLIKLAKFNCEKILLL